MKYASIAIMVLGIWGICASVVAFDHASSGIFFLAFLTTIVILNIID